MMATRDFYEVLGVARTASQEEIQRAYRTLARRYHPDVNTEPGSEDRFKEITEAYEVLSDPEQRARYDRFGPTYRQVPPDYDPRTGTPFGTGPGGGQRVYVNTGPLGGGFETDFGVPGFGGAPFGDMDFMDFADLLGGFFRGGRGTARVPGADREAEIELSVEDAYFGGRRRIALNTAAGPRSYDVTIPAGVTAGQRIRLAGQGGQRAGGAPAGDLYLVVRLAPHPLYRVNGRDLTVELPVAPWEAALGGSIRVPTPAGFARVDLPAGSSSGRRLRLRGRGLPHPRGPAGDLYAEVKIVIPARPSARERELFERLAAESRFDPRAGRVVAQRR
jgi:curved DNA-binding protein